MFKILVILLGVLNGNDVKTTLLSEVLYPTKAACIEATSSEVVVKDIRAFANNMKQLGYTDLSIDKFECIAEERPL